MERTSQAFLRNGDVVETEIEEIGTLRNRIVARRDLPPEPPHEHRDDKREHHAD